MSHLTGQSSTPAPPGASKPPPQPLVLRLYPALGVPSFRLLWLGMLPATLAWQMSVVTTGYAALTLSGSATAIGLVSSAMGLPLVLLALVGGVVADRISRRAVLLATQGTLGLAAAALAALALGGVLQVWHLAALGLVQGAALSFNMPARQAFIAELVGRRLLRNAIAVNNAGMNFGRIAGPALAGGLIAVPAIGIRGVFVLMAAMYAGVLASLLRLPAGLYRPGEAQPGRAAGGREQLVEGLKYIRSSPALVALLGLAFITLFFGMPYLQLMPVFSERVFNVGAAGLGVLMAASGVGALAGSIMVATLASFSRPAMLQLWLGVSFGLTLVGFALAPSFPLAVVLLPLVGFSSAAYSALNNTLVMGNTEPRLYGRVMSVYLLTFAVMPFGALPMAWLADQLGGRATLAGAGLVVAAVVAGTALLYPPYRRIR
ncbi:MAG: MFS transporter [Chloroflexi bacterium]|nr:MFS transporter [Chloroflexota bacterium]